MNRAPLSFVHHANQFVITDGYTDRDGIRDTAAGYDAVLSLHVELGIPASLHISGPVLEAIAWHRPALLGRLRDHLASGVISLIGGTYGENVLPLCSARHNRRQLRSFHELVEDLLQIPRQELRTAWVPERVWSTAACAAPLRDEHATGVSYQRVLLDDRLAYPLREGAYAGSDRERFDAVGPYGWPTHGYPDRLGHQVDAASVLPYRIAGGDGLVAVPVASHLRYLVPPHDVDHLRLIGDLAQRARNAPDGALLVFADDLERTAGVAGWELGLERYARFLRWLSRTEDLEVVALDRWCDQVDPAPDVAIEAGTYYELAHLHGAGEDYRHWADDTRWRPIADRLDTVEQALDDAEDDGADPDLCALAERLVMLGRHETAWQDPHVDGGRAPAPWVRATAAHAADALPLLAAARWVSQPGSPGLQVRVTDLDDDGSEELVLNNDRLFAVLSLRYGGRLSLLVQRSHDEEGKPTGTVLVGNPADHWNFQEELHRHMADPPNHPGALGVHGTEAHVHDLGRVEVTPEMALVQLIDVEPGPDRGLTKQLLLRSGSDALVVCVQRSGLPGELRTTVALSPDYPELLRGGKDSLRVQAGHAWWAAGSGPAQGWVAYAPDEQTRALLDISPTTGHARVGAVDGCGRHLHLVLGCGAVDDDTGPTLIADADDYLHPTRPEPVLSAASRSRAPGEPITADVVGSGDRLAPVPTRRSRRG